MQCSHCGQENPPQAKFCLGCGVRLALACPQCGTELPAAARFCLECGRPVSAGSASESKLFSPQAYTPKHLAEKILTSKSALEGERKQVTVLFADLKGSMELLADRDLEEARQILDPVLERIMEAVHRYEGTENQVMGDGIMALFGAPIACEDHAVRACYAALRMQETVKRYAEGVRRAEGIPLQIRVGLNSGEVVVRSTGSDLHMDYTAVGQTTHVAARMEQMAAPGTILITPDSLRLAEGFVQVQPLGATTVKGLAEAVEVFELTGASPVRSRLQAAAARGLTRFVGRDAELDHLHLALEQARSGHGQVVAVVGEPGVGMLGHVYAMAGRVPDALPLLGQAIEWAGRDRRTYESLFVAYVSEAHLQAGRPDEARAVAQRALDLSRERRERGVEARALYLLAEITSRSDPPRVEEADAHYREAVALAHELGMRPLQAHCHLGLGRLYRQTEKRQQAHEHLLAAASMYREMDMRFWLEKAEAELAGPS